MVSIFVALKRHSMKKTILLWGLVCFGVATGCTTAIHSRVPIPQPQIVPCDDSLPQEFKNFPRRWERYSYFSDWPGTMDLVFIVEEFISQNKAKIIYAWGDSSWGKGGYYQGPIKIIYQPGKITFVMATVTLYYEHNQMIGTKPVNTTYGGLQIAKIIMKPF